MSRLLDHLNRPPRGVYLSLAALYMGGIYLLSSLRIHYPETDFPRVWSFFGNLFHFPLYGGLGLLLLLGFGSRAGEAGRLLTLRSATAALLALTLYGAFDEYHQSWTGRTPAISDFLVDCLGGLAAVLLLKGLAERSLAPARAALLFAATLLAACLLAVNW